MVQLNRLCTILLATSVWGANAYIPTTWINGTPHTIYAPIGLTNNIHKEKMVLLLGKSNISADAFSFIEWSKIGCGPRSVYGIAAEGQLSMHQILKRLHSQVNISVISNGEESYIYETQEFKHNRTVSLDDTHVSITWDAINKKYTRFSGYIFGIIPATKHSLFGTKKRIRWVGLDNHFAWGCGFESSFGLWKKTLQTLDWIWDVDVTFLEGRSGMAWVQNNAIYKPYPINICATQQYKIRSTMAYTSKHWMCDGGVLCFYIPNLRHSTNLNIVKQNVVEPSSHSESLFGDIGAMMQTHAVLLYISTAAQVTMHNAEYRSWGFSGKLGLVI